MQTPTIIPTTDICDVDIEIPKQTNLQMRHFDAAVQPLLTAQIAAIANAMATIEALQATCQQFQQQVAALRQRLVDAEQTAGA